MFFRLVTVTFTVLFTFFISVILNSQQPEILWQFDTDDSAYGMTAAGDIDGDGKLELVFGCYRNDGNIYALNAEDGSLLWKYNAKHPFGDGCNDVAPILFDIDGDGVLEVIVPSSCNPIVTCFNGKDGSVIWQTATRGSDSPPTIADIDKDGKFECLFGEFGGYVMCVDVLTGSFKWEIVVDKNSWIQTAPTIADLDSDGNLDFIVSTWNAVEGDTNRIYAYRGYDQKLLWTYDIQKYTYHGTSVTDLDDDGLPEIVIGDYSGTLYALNGEDGSEVWTYKKQNDYYIGCPVSIGDLDGDGNCEMVFASWFYLICLNKDATVKWTYSIPDYGQAFRGVILTDVNDDYLPDVVFGANTGRMTALNGKNGELIWMMDFQEIYGDTFDINHAPVVADFDGDNLPELFFIGGKTNYPATQDNYGRGYCLSLKRGKGPDWLMFQNNIHRNANICDEITSVSENEISLDRLISIYPNPFAEDVNIVIDNQRNFKSAVIKDLLGRTVRILESNQSENSFIWNGRDNNESEVRNGMYLVYFDNEKQAYRIFKNR